MVEPRYRIERLARHHQRELFCCGEEALDRYLRQQARRDVARHVAAIYVLIDEGTEEVAGYYSLSSGSLLRAELPPEIATRLPKYTKLPAVLLGRLAVDLRHQRRRLGQVLLFDAMRRVMAWSTEIATMPMVVDAKNDRARAFYEQVGFLRFPDDDSRLFLMTATIADLLRDQA